MIDQATVHIDYDKLNASLVGIPCPEHYFEIVIKDPTQRSQFPVLSKFPLTLFPAVRTLFQTDSFLIARVYIGAEKVSMMQSMWIDELMEEEPLFRNAVEVPAPEVQ